VKNKARAHLIVKGRVQGVCYRATTAETATELGLTGWVRNRGDGGVEIVAEGEKSAVEKLVEWCRQGPPMAKVTSALVDWETPTGEFESFDVAY